MNIVGERCSVKRARYMRIVSICIAGLLASGCATVSMTTGKAVVKNEISVQQSELRTASIEYCDKTVSNGWVGEPTSIWGYANRLINGKSLTDKAANKQEYANLIGADTEAPSTVFLRISADAKAARAGLVDVTGTAAGILNSNDSKTGRGDVMSYERALVNAQKTHRAFSKAADLAGIRAGGVPAETEAALNDFAQEIDMARDTADTLAERYASITLAAAG